MIKKFNLYPNVIKSEVQRSHELNKRNRSNKAEKIMKSLEDHEQSQKKVKALPSKHVVAVANFIKKLNIF